MRNTLSSTPEIREVRKIELIIINIFYQNVPSRIEASTKCELETGLLCRIGPGINVKVLARVVATDQGGAGSSLGGDSLYSNL